jgi:hypothetical protein
MNTTPDFDVLVSYNTLDHKAWSASPVPSREDNHRD